MAPFFPRTRAADALRMKQIALHNQCRMIRCLRAKLATKIRESAATKEGLETKAENTIQEQHLIIEALVEEKASLLQIIQGLEEDNGAPAPFDDEWRNYRKKTRKKKGLRIFL
ncbi:hypothetical protein F511_35166 [Dorcoceras hygrometricum]|uniref:Uncharacterized protein n=1 Tax=Dorcoceras hygrometricum TaxID=472368 RepID=A0A2Z7D0V3_9LAMI|nr:hypothetical protein F511_35166 [Dorcoceras hygrometricum]